MQAFPHDSVTDVQALIAATNGNLTALREITAPAWVAGPNVRGTLSIVWSCVVTLVACVYTALHLNIPTKHGGAWAMLLHKSKWVVVAIFAPEIVLYIASAQFFEARALQMRFKKLLRERKSPGTDPEEVRWSLCSFTI